MSPASPRLSRSAILLAAAMVWLASVTLCSTGLFAEAPHAHPASSEHPGHAHGPAHDDGDHQPDSGCGCESFKAFPAQTTALLKAPVPSVAGFHYPILIEELIHDYAAITIPAPVTGPPGRVSFAELVFQRCLLSHAPPLVV